MPTVSAGCARAAVSDPAGRAGRFGSSAATSPGGAAQGLLLSADHPLSMVDRIVRDVMDESRPRPVCGTGAVATEWPGTEPLARALLLQVLYALERDERLLEQLRYDLRFRWFIRLHSGEAVWTGGVHVRARQALLQSVSGRHLLGDLLRNVRPIALTWPEHFSFNEALIEHWQAEDGDRATASSVDAHQRDLLRAAGFPSDDCAVDGRLIRAMELILTRLCEPGLNGDTVAAEVGMSRRALYYLFEAHGLTPSMVIRNIRLNHCKRLLEDPRHGNRKISAIALDYGFGNVYTFSRTFKQRYGVGPRECRPDRRR